MTSAYFSPFDNILYNFVREINNRTLRRADKIIISASPIPEYEEKAIVERAPQSLLLNFLKLPDGQIDKIIKKQNKQEQNK